MDNAVIVALVTTCGTVLAAIIAILPHLIRKRADPPLPPPVPPPHSNHGPEPPRPNGSSPAPLGLFASYNEAKNGPFQTVVDFCNTHEYILWFENAAIDTQKFSFPTTILVKITGEDRYYRGKLKCIKRAEEVDRAVLLADCSHRPPKWIEVDKDDYPGFKSVLYVEAFKQVPRPVKIRKDEAPQRPYYKEEADLKDSGVEGRGHSKERGRSR